MRYKSSLNFFVFILSCLSLAAQTKTIDSLASLIKTDKADTNQINHLLLLCAEYRNSGQHQLGLKHCNKAIALSASVKTGNQTGWLKGISKAYICKGNIYLDIANYSEAMNNYNSALRVSKLTNNKREIGQVYNQIGTIYLYKSNYKEALNNYFTSLELRREVNDSKGTADSYLNIGTVYYYLADYSEALKYYLFTLKIAERLKNKQLIASCYINKGNIHFHLNEFPQALENFYTALTLEEELNEKHRVALIYNNIAEINTAQGNDSEALKNFEIALKIGEQLDAKILQATVYGNIGRIQGKQLNFSESLKNYTVAIDINKKINNAHGLAFTLLNLAELKIKLSKYADANVHIQEALTYSRLLGSKDLIKESYGQLAHLDSIQGHWKDAYQHHKQFTVYKDSIDNEEIRKKTLTNSITADFERKAALQKAEQDKKEAVEAENRKKQQLVLMLVSCVLALLLVFVFVIFRSLKLTRKQKRIIETKNKDIIDSINYAKRIQDALLNSEAHRKENLPEYFVLYKPKDIVSGDFYWNIEKQGYWYLAVADCTGHGVPGAFMSMLGVAFLNEITADSHLFTPAEILEQLRSKIVKELGQGGRENETKDGMDISLLRLDLRTKELQWAGANTPLYYIQQERINVIKADKQPIGYHLSMKPFTNHVLKPETTSSFYLFTDGYADQFGGAKAKKFMNKNLKDLMVSIHTKPVQEQKQLLAANFDAWKGNLEQVDDVCIIGVRI